LDSDEAWLVADRDGWEEEHINLMVDWAKQKANYGFALSNPKFEFWLLLHFDDGKGITSSRSCSEQLRQHLPDYNKGVAANKITRVMVETAIRRAEQRDNNKSEWPVTTGTTVYRLVRNILEAEEG
jgi:hypothetical protein